MATTTYFNPIDDTIACMVDAGLITQQQGDELAKIARGLTASGASPQKALEMGINLMALQAASGGGGPSAPDDYAGNLDNEQLPYDSLLVSNTNLTIGNTVSAVLVKAFSKGLISATGITIAGGETLSIQKQVGGTWYPLNNEDQISLPNGYTVITWPETNMRVVLIGATGTTNVHIKIVYVAP